METDPTGTIVQFQDSALQVAYESLTSGSVLGMRAAYLVENSSIRFVLQDGRLENTGTGDDVGRTGPATLIKCAKDVSETGVILQVPIIIDKIKAKDYVPDPLFSMQYLTQEEWGDVLRARDLRIDIYHEILHAIQYIDYVESPNRLLNPFWDAYDPMPRVDPYNGPLNVAPDIGVIDPQHALIRELEKLVAGELPDDN